LFRKHVKPLVIPEKAETWDEQCTLMVIKTWEDGGLSVRTRQSLLRILSKYVKFCGGPTLETKRFSRLLERSEQQAELTVLSKDQAGELMKACKRLEPKFYPILLLALHAGLRRGEIFGLRCGDVDVFKNRIRVAHSYDGPTKNGKTRYVPMSEELIKTMTDARNLLMRPVNERVFEISNPNYTLRRLLGHCGYGDIRFHDLRHTFATLALEDGVSPRIVANWLGHASVYTTLSIYWNLSKDEANINDFLPGS
jgi:integrase